jgi:hypothetical protein
MQQFLSCNPDIGPLFVSLDYDTDCLSLLLKEWAIGGSIFTAHQTRFWWRLTKQEKNSALNKYFFHQFLTCSCHVSWHSIQNALHRVDIPVATRGRRVMIKSSDQQNFPIHRVTTGLRIKIQIQRAKRVHTDFKPKDLFGAIIRNSATASIKILMEFISTSIWV